MARPPNLLFIFSDQQRPDTLGAYGVANAHTPQLDALAARSVVFERTYCTEPICTPSRAALMTGQWPHQLGVTVNDTLLPKSARALPEMLPGDHHCAYSGKWHLGDEIIPQHGFTHWTSVSDGYRDGYRKPDYLEQFSDYYHYLRGQGLEPEYEFCGAKTFRVTRTARLPFGQTKPMFQARAARAFIREQGDKPFVAYVSFIEPHRPYYSPCDHLHPPENVPVGPEFRQRPPAGVALVKRMLHEHFLEKGEIDGEDITTDIGCRRLRSRYLGMCSLIDTAVGEMLAALDETGQRENTIIVYTSDHGDLVGDHGLWGKSCLYESSARVPLILHVPGIAARRISAPVSQIDLVPTLLEALGAPRPDHLAGRSWLPLLRSAEGEDMLGDVFVEFEGDDGLPKRGPQSPFPEAWHDQIRGPWRSIITREGWKLNLSPTDSCELYDLNRDPTEAHNLHADPPQQARVRDLTTRLRAWQERTCDLATLPTP